MYTDGEENMTVEQFRDLLMAVYKLAMDYYPEGPQTCRQLFKTIQAVTESAVSIHMYTLASKYLRTKTRWLMKRQ